MTTSSVTINNLYKTDIDTNAKTPVAYNTVPNLENTQLSIYLAVDVNWQTGLSFSETIQ